MTSNCSNKSFSSIFFALGPFYFFLLRLGFFLILIEEEMDQWHYLWIRVGQDKMYGVCYDDSSQNNIMTDIDKHSTLLLPNPIQHHFWHVVLVATVPIKCPLTFPFLATFQSSKPAPKKYAMHVRFCVGSWEQNLHQTKLTHKKLNRVTRRVKCSKIAKINTFPTRDFWQRKLRVLHK